jgi:hypothetical protein
LLSRWLYQELTKPASKFGKRAIAITEQWSLKVLFSIPNDLIFGHLLTNVANNRLTDRFSKSVLGRPWLNESVGGVSFFWSHWGDIGQ